MGKFHWPRQMDTLELRWMVPDGTGMGIALQPFFVDDVDALIWPLLAGIEHHALYPRTHQRGRSRKLSAPIISACACGNGVWALRWRRLPPAARRRVCSVSQGLTGRAVRIDLDGGTWHIDWREVGLMTGPSAMYSAVLTPSFLES